MTTEIATSHNKLNALRASVLGANDGIVSTAGLVLGVAGVTIDKESVLLAGIAGLIAGALSMAAGEYVSVSSQRDSHRAYEKRKKNSKAKAEPVADGVELAKQYLALGMNKNTALLAAKEVTQAGKAKDALGLENKDEVDHSVNPWYSSASSATAFIAGAAIPLLTIALSPVDIAPFMTMIAVVISLILTGTLSATVGRASRRKAAVRVVSWGVAVMAITYGIGSLIGVSMV